MDKYGYSGPEQFRPLSPWAYFGYSLLFSIPLVGFILLIVFSLSDGNYNRRNYARSYFCALLIPKPHLINLYVFKERENEWQN